MTSSSEMNVSSPVPTKLLRSKKIKSRPYFFQVYVIYTAFNPCVKSLTLSLFFPENIHNIQFEMESIIERTLILQRPNMMLEKRIDAQVQVDLEIFNQPSKEEIKTESYSKETSENGAVTKEVASTSKEAEKLVEVTEKQHIPWFAGCEYQCKYDDCGTMFFYNQDLRGHIKKEHGDPDLYLDKYKMFETKTEHIVCKECNTEIKRHFSSVFVHLRDIHDGMKIEDYQKKHKMKDYDKFYKVKKKVITPTVALTKHADYTLRPFECSICKFACNQKANCERHIRNCHDKNYEDARDFVIVHGNPEPKVKPEPRENISSNTSNTVISITRKRKNSSPVPPSPITPNTKAPKFYPKAETPNTKAPKFYPKADLPPWRPWYDGQEYECQICHKLHFELNKLLFHIRNHHNITGKPYQVKFILLLKYPFWHEY